MTNTTKALVALFIIRLAVSCAAASLVVLLFWIGGMAFERSPVLAICAVCAIAVFVYMASAPAWRELWQKPTP